MLPSSSAYALNCQQVRQLVSHYFKLHFYHHEFNDELSRRTLENFLKAWDPGKVYFLKSDIKQLEERYATKLDDAIMDADCKPIEEVIKLYGKRFEERQATIPGLISGKYDFKVDEYMTIDRKRLDYANSVEELTERHRQRIKFQLLQLKLTLSDLEKAKEKLVKRYQLASKRHKELTSDDVYSTFLNAFSSSLDPHSDYLSADSLEDFRISTRLSLEGIGAVLRSEDGFTTIQSLVPGGAAANTGKVNVDDKIIAVGQAAEAPVDVIDMDLREVVKLIRGTRKTEVRLTIVREEAGKTVQLVVPIIREQIQLKDRAAKSQVISVKVEDPTAGPQKSREYRVGVIDLPSFYMDFEGRQNREKGYKSSSADMRQEIKKLKNEKVDAIVIDLRSNGGGSLDESIDIAGFFFEKGPVVQTKDTRGSVMVQKDENPETLYSGPLLVLINRQSASASEIFAGAIQDYQRGIIIGDSHTFGKGTVQTLNDLDETLGAVKVTVNKFYRPSGSSTQLKGVESDVVLPDLMDEYEIGEKHYDYALPWEKIKASDYKATSQVNLPLIKTLKTASETRVKTDPAFAKIFESIEEYRKSEESRSKVSLKEDVAANKVEDKLKPGDKKKGSDKTAAKAGSDKKTTPPETQDEDSDRAPLKDDPQLQETLRVAGDYLQILNKRPLGPTVIPGLVPSQVATQAPAPNPPSKDAKKVQSPAGAP